MGRFDQTERKPTRERRSRSPSSRTSEPIRERSPIQREETDTPSKEQLKADAAARAKAAAERINASLAAKKAIQTVDVPPIRSASTEAAKKSSGVAGVSDEIYTQDGDFIRDIEVNDLRNRYTLTKGSTQKMIKEETGADVTTRGEYYPDKTLATAASPPLYLHITSTSKEGLEQAVAKINELMQQELPNLVDERRFRRREPEQFERDELGRRKWPEERIPIDLEPIPGFNLRAQVVGHGGAYVKHIQQETRCRVQIKGQNSGFMEPNTGRESDEPMYLHVAGPDPNEVKRARGLCEDLLASVKSQYESFKERGGARGRYGDRESNGGGRGGYGGGGREYGGGRDSGDHYGYGSQQSPTGQGDPNSQTATPSSANADYAAQYAQYYQQYQQYAQNGQDPYAAYGGYANYMAMYQQYYAQQAGQDQSGGTPTQATSQAPPPPPSNDAPPPPPPSGSDAPPPPPPGVPSGYNNVPPPPGL
ncbi:hypothetical protein EJ05DRAFT_474748 [Pseudovirgaria hyperparasitica]|uniref:K Homology domain-containing protein n=1 Tax=Pseudovirgaria hyperparasitica TaxID=470096 RepID=A0A6A6WCJ5_9PEZI|nr:uncharacterized protein EJ05DRAFT_474748 [Pseudovirgaria hyperparasitica]KAF2759680.1 hypothetical protein EJ05DRAFT_474748 [Pseudovirgaria hyperparasitica]